MYMLVGIQTLEQPFKSGFRLKDGNIVATTSGGSSSTLEFSSLTVDQAGYYSCRANNDYGAILSSDAHINVKGGAKVYLLFLL